MILERSENLAGETILTIQSSRGEEYVINADKLAEALAELRSDMANERKFGWTLSAGWYEDQLGKLVKAADAEPSHDH